MDDYENYVSEGLILNISSWDFSLSVENYRI